MQYFMDGDTYYASEKGQNYIGEPSTAKDKKAPRYDWWKTDKDIPAGAVRINENQALADTDSSPEEIGESPRC